MIRGRSGAGMEHARVTNANWRDVESKLDRPPFCASACAKYGVSSSSFDGSDRIWYSLHLRGRMEREAARVAAQERTGPDEGWDGSWMTLMGIMMARVTASVFFFLPTSQRTCNVSDWQNRPNLSRLHPVNSSQPGSRLPSPNRGQAPPCQEFKIHCGRSRGRLKRRCGELASLS